MDPVELEKSLVQKIEELGKKLNTEFATKADVEAHAKALTDLQTARRTAEQQACPHALFGTQKAFDAVAGAIGKELVRVGKIDKDAKDSFWVQKAGEATLNQTDSGKGPTFIPVGIDPVVSKLVNDWGVARRLCRVLPGVKGQIDIQKRNVRVTVSGQARPDATITPAGSTYTEAALTTKEVSAITTVEEKLIWDSPINVVEEAMSDLAEGAAETEDLALFVGDGSAAYFGFTGLKTAANVGEISVAAASYSVDDWLNLRTKVHPSVLRSPRLKYITHPYQWSWLLTQKASTSGTYHFNPATGTYIVGGVPLEFSTAIDDTQTADEVPVFLGDAQKAVTMGLGRPAELRILTELYAANNALGLRLTYDAGYLLVQPTAMARITLAAS